MLRRKLGDIPDLAIDDNPAVLFGVVLGDLLHGD